MGSKQHQCNWYINVFDITGLKHMQWQRIVLNFRHSKRKEKLLFHSKKIHFEYSSHYQMSKENLIMKINGKGMGETSQSLTQCSLLISELLTLSPLPCCYVCCSHTGNISTPKTCRSVCSIHTIWCLLGRCAPYSPWYPVQVHGKLEVIVYLKSLSWCPRSLWGATS